MDGKKSKFEYCRFNIGTNCLAVNKGKFTEDEAITLLSNEIEGCIGNKKGEYVLVNGYVKWRAGIDNDGDKCVGWWLEWTERQKGSVPCYVFEQRLSDKY